MGFAGYGSLYDEEAMPQSWKIPGSSLYDSKDAFLARKRAGEPKPAIDDSDLAEEEPSGRVSPAAFSESDLFDEGPAGGGQLTEPTGPAPPPIRPELQRVMDLARARGGDPTFNPTSGIGYNGSGYVLTAEEQKQVEDLDGAISKVKQQDDLDDVQKGMALQQLQQKRHALDPGGNYGPRSPRGQMTPAAKWASQNVYKDPQSGLIFYNDGHGWKHVKDEHADRVHQAAILAKTHAHEAEHKRQDRLADAEAKRQERADKREADAETKRQAAQEKSEKTRHDAFQKYVTEHQERHKVTDEKTFKTVAPPLEDSHEYAKRRMELEAEQGMGSLGSDWKPSKEFLKSAKEGITSPQTSSSIDRAGKAGDVEAVRDLRKAEEIRLRYKANPSSVTPAELEFYKSTALRLSKYGGKA